MIFKNRLPPDYACVLFENCCRSRRVINACVNKMLVRQLYSWLQHVAAPSLFPATKRLKQTSIY